jgi:Ni/Co efflux regulator RcnB
MTTRHIAVGAIALLMFGAPPVARATSGQRGEQAATDQKSRSQAQFTTQDRQAASDWYGKNQANPPAGFRAQDRLSSDQESRLQVGSKLDPDLQKMTRTVPSDLRHKLATPAPGYRYLTVGGHVTLLDKQNQVQDIIRHPYGGSGR